MKRKFEELTFKQVFWQREIDFKSVLELVGQIATQEPHKPIIWEIRSPKDGDSIRFFLGAEKSEFNRLEKIFRGYGRIDFSSPLVAHTSKRTPVKLCKKLSTTRPMLSLKTSDNEALCRAVLTTLAQVEKDDELVLQLVIGGTLSPKAVAKNLPDPTQTSWWHILSGDIPVATADIRNSIKSKTESFQLNCVIRLGVNAKDPAKRQSYILSLFSALKTLEAIGVKLYLQNEEANRLNQATAPWHYSQRLSIKEMANLFLLPTGESSFLGIRDIHPKILLPPRTSKKLTRDKVLRPFAETMHENPEERQPLYLSDEAGSRHCHIVGPTGSGKSVVMENMILSDIEAGGTDKNKQKGIIVIDPKYSLIESLVQKIPEHRLDDVVILNLADMNNPVGLNPFNTSDNHAERTSEAILSSIKGLFAETWGVYTEDILQSAILTLAKNKDKNVTLAHLQILLNNPSFRKRMTTNLNDKLGLEAYWEYFNSLSDGERNKQLAPVMNKMRVLMRPALRQVLFQPKPLFDLESVFKENKILLVPLNTSIVGDTVAEIVGSLLIGMIWNIALKQAETPENQRQNNSVSLYIDEFQAYVKKSGESMEQMLSMARSLGLKFIFCHQHLGQLSTSLKESVMANARNKIFFATSNKADAKEFAALSPALSSEDYLKLAPYSIYAFLLNNPSLSSFVSGKTFPPRPSLRDPAEVFARSAEKYGAKNLEEIEKSYIDLIEKDKTEVDLNPLDNIDSTINVGMIRQKPAKKEE
ncbi:type IV secretory system conjugative DNA transfer family protein [Candidatus Enterococcus clewellii]|uniref:Type IV secretion system coupling protein TraD DNA-binding domain-containing protein n=2 Tax=Candidatus Enterococcus clewellii TaxID=1834193 RepID=A0AAQ3W4G6_9ENTE